MQFLDTQTLLTVILTLPLISAVLIASFFRKKPVLAKLVSVGTAGIVMMLAGLFLWEWNGRDFHYSLEWLSLGQWQVRMGFFINAQAAVLLFIVTFVGFWIHVFSIGYMREDESQPRFFGGLSIFMFSMLGIVLANNLFMLFIFWELVGFSSYMLIAHYYATPDAQAASKKAFIVNRIGDFGFLIGIVWAYWHFRTVNLADLKLIVAQNPALISKGIALLLMCGFLGKSAQFPLHVWLPDAMAGPTPVSALIHAATMVAAGIYFLCRVDFLIPADVKTIILWLGAGMTLFAGLCALSQRDIKKILAYSTLSQLGYMAAAYGLGYPGLAFFHLSTHAFFKALLFLGAGSIIHACHHEQDIFKMGGLLRRMPITAITFIVGTLALCGVTYFSGYFSKDAIIEAAFLKDQKVFWLILFSAFLTSFYMGRLIWIAFFGEAKSSNADHAHENGIWILVPLLVLTICSSIGGFLKFWPSAMAFSFEGDLHSVEQALHGTSEVTFLFIATTAAWAVGLISTIAVYGLGAHSDRLQQAFPRVFKVLESNFYIDNSYNWYVKKVQDRMANLLSFVSKLLFDFVMVQGSAVVVSLVGFFCRGLHVGNLHVYVFWFAVGVILFGVYTFKLFINF